jgi:molybdate transport system substrate-binding protein
VRTAASLKQALSGARSLAYTRDGASRPHIDKMLNSLGIAAELQPRTRLLGPGQAPESVAKGEADLVITLISEILPVDGVELAGSLPAEYQNYVSFAAAAAVGAGDAKAVAMLIEFVDGPGVAATYEAKGMEPR